MSEAIEIALTHNLDIQAEKENINLRVATSLTEKSRFDSTLQINTSLKKFIPSQDVFAIGVEWTKPLKWGGETGIVLQQLRTDTTFQAVNSTDQGDLLFKIRQPLLKGFGRAIKQTPLKIAKTEIEISHQVFLSRVTETLLNVITLYWELVFQENNFLVKQSSLKLAHQLLELNRTKVELGLLAPIEILVAESSIALREEAVLIAQKGREDTEDQLKQLLNREETLLPSDLPIEEEARFNLNDLLLLAKQNRPEIEAARLQIQNRLLSMQAADNQIRPSLDFLGTVGSNESWEAGFLFTYPIENRAAAAGLAIETAQQKKMQLAKEKLLSQVTLEVMEGERRTRTDFERVTTTRRALALARKQYIAAEERFRLGLLASHDLIEFQNEVATASINAIRAIVDYNVALAKLDRVTGRLLSKYKIESTD